MYELIQVGPKSYYINSPAKYLTEYAILLWKKKEI